MNLFGAYSAALLQGNYRNAYDEMFFDAPAQTPRPHYKALFSRLQTLEAHEFEQRVALTETSLMNQGITFTVYGDTQGTERTFPVDLIPRIIPPDEWDVIERGLTQRINALNEFLRDIYSPDPRVLRDKIIPEDLIKSAAHYRPEFVGMPVPRDIYVHICGTDLIRDAQGNWCVLEDNLRTPSGVSYVLENRQLLTRVFPQLFAANSIRPVDHYTTTLLSNLRALSPRRDANVVLLTPGVYNSAYFEHAFLAQQMGIELVHGNDLFADDDCIWMKTTRGAQRVDVIYRRVDDDFLDPDVFRADSGLGVRGLMQAYSKGNVALANAVGTGVADDKVIYRYVPDLIKYYLDQDALLPNIPTYCAWEDTERDYIVQNIGKLVVKAANESGGYGMLVGPQASRAEQAEFVEKVVANPRNYLAQPLVELSTAPCFLPGANRENGIVPRRVDLRPYVLSGPDGVTIIPGGLTRVALQEGSYVVNSSQGGGSKDTWVLAPPRRQSQSQSQSGGGKQSQSQSQSMGVLPGDDPFFPLQSQMQSGMGGINGPLETGGDGSKI